MLESLELHDPEERYAAVRLRSDLPLAEREFVRNGGSWVLRLPELGLGRLEYQLETVDREGNSEVILDPGNPERAPSAFGEKSVAIAGDYRPPDWLEAPHPDGTFDAVDVTVLGQRLSIPVWSPARAEGELPMLLAHDGPEYDRLASLTRYAGAMIERGSLPPFRVALLAPGHRDEWYSASAAYSRALANRILPALENGVQTAGRPAGMGASLGGLAMLHAQRTWPGSLAGSFLQSSSFFVPRYDRHESRFPRYARITRFVGGVLRAGSTAETVPVSMTCGIEEENVHNNRLMASALRAQGYMVNLTEVPDLHNYTNWRDALEPHLTSLLRALWMP